MCSTLVVHRAAQPHTDRQQGQGLGGAVTMCSPMYMCVPWEESGGWSLQSSQVLALAPLMLSMLSNSNSRCAPRWSRPTINNTRPGTPTARQAPRLPPSTLNLAVSGIRLNQEHSSYQ